MLVLFCLWNLLYCLQGWAVVDGTSVGFSALSLKQNVIVCDPVMLVPINLLIIVFWLTLGCY